MKIAVVGATGMVGEVMLKVLAERNFPITDLLLVASEKSVGKTMEFMGKPYRVISLADAVAARPNIALFSAGGSISLEWAPKFAEVGTTVIDNSSAWRMEADKKLIVPEINANILTKEDKIIANPNCSTIQLVMVLKPLDEFFKIKRVVVSTYQSVTGTGVKAVAQLMAERKNQEVDKVYAHPIDLNVIPHCDTFLENGYTKEEMKLVNEPRKILGLPELNITATAVRVPVVGGHSESVNISFEKEFELSAITALLSKAPGVVVLDNPGANQYPMPLIAKDKNEVFVGRIRRDESMENCLNLWIVADNLRKGAATNAVQIAEYLVENHLV